MHQINKITETRIFNERGKLHNSGVRNFYMYQVIDMNARKIYSVFGKE